MRTERAGRTPGLEDFAGGVKATRCCALPVKEENNMKSKQRNVLQALAKGGLCLGALLVSGSAGADVVTTYASYECRGGVDVGNQGGRTEGQAFLSLRTYCPLDRIQSDVAGSISNIVVRGNDTSSSGNIRCRAYSCNGEGTTCYVTGWASSSSTGYQWWSVGSVSTHSTGYAYLECEMPNSTSSISSYRATD